MKQDDFGFRDRVSIVYIISTTSMHIFMFIHNIVKHRKTREYEIYPEAQESMERCVIQLMGNVFHYYQTLK